MASASDPRNRSVEDLVVGDRVVTNGKERTLTGIERVATDARYGDYFRLDFGTEAVFYYGQTIVSVRGDAASDPSGAEMRSPNALFVAMDIGCIECGEDSALLGLFSTREAAQVVLDAASEAQKKGWHGQHNFQIFEGIAP